MTEVYKDKTIRQIETEFDEMMISVSKYKLSKITGVAETIFSKVKKGERTFSVEKKIDMLEKYHAAHGEII